MITMKEAVTAAFVVAVVGTLSILGQWLSANAPELLAAWRFVNGAVILFSLVILLFKWDVVQSDLRLHRDEIALIFQRIEQFLKEDAEARRAVVDELSKRTEQIAEAIAKRNDELARKRHDELESRLTQAIESRVESDKKAAEHYAREEKRDALWSGSPPKEDA